MKEPFDRNEARRYLSSILTDGFTIFSRHANGQIKERGLTALDVTNVLRNGKIFSDPELEHGSWRYKVETDHMCAVVAFRSETKVVVVTAWRKE